MTTVQKIAEIEAEMARTQKNKATNGHLGMLKAKLAKFKRELLEPATSGGGGGSGFDVSKSGVRTRCFCRRSATRVPRSRFLRYLPCLLCFSCFLLLPPTSCAHAATPSAPMLRHPPPRTGYTSRISGVSIGGKVHASDEADGHVLRGGVV